MVTIESPEHLWAVRMAVEELAQQRLPYRAMFLLRRWRQEIHAHHAALMQDLKPALPEGGVSPGDEAWPGFVEAARESFQEPVEIDLDPIQAKHLEPLFDRSDFAYPEALFEVLVAAGIIDMM